MNGETKPVVTEEPLPGWLRFEQEGQKPYYKSPFPRTVMRAAAMMKDFLDKEHLDRRMTDVEGSEFSFKRRLGLKKKALELNPVALDLNPVLIQSEEAPDQEIVDGSIASKPMDEPRSIVDLLTRDPSKLTEHRKLLSNMSKQIDAFRPDDAYETQPNFGDLREKLAGAADLRDIMAFMSEDQKVTEALAAMFSDMCLAEVSQIDSTRGPLVEFPASVNENVYCKIAEYGRRTCPQLMSLVVNLVVRKGEPVLPTDVLKIATLFCSMCHAANHDIDALVKLRSITLQMDGLTNLGLDIVSD